MEKNNEGKMKRGMTEEEDAKEKNKLNLQGKEIAKMRKKYKERKI